MGQAFHTAVASPQELEAAKKQGALIIDVRTAGERAALAVPGSIHLEWDGAKIPTKGLPVDKDALIIVHCGVGKRAAGAKTFMEGLGYTQIINGGGPRTEEQWAVLMS
mmetsp:Transcript_14453/g.32837  ORF Transcript_14453/g.32837 Transcript_14453/m.32837 type:complete len:108 (+) Transcript_14453:65-388(+)